FPVIPHWSETTWARLPRCPPRGRPRRKTKIEKNRARADDGLSRPVWHEQPLLRGPPSSGPVPASSDPTVGADSEVSSPLPGISQVFMHSSGLGTFVVGSVLPPLPDASGTSAPRPLNCHQLN